VAVRSKLVGIAGGRSDERPIRQERLPRVGAHNPEAADRLSVVRLGRAIGVIYEPATERQSHYFHVRPADQFDAMIHIDRTRALEPLKPRVYGSPAKSQKRTRPGYNHQRAESTNYGDVSRASSQPSANLTLI
jgi:hypothetical protein